MCAYLPTVFTSVTTTQGPQDFWQEQRPIGALWGIHSFGIFIYAHVSWFLRSLTSDIADEGIHHVLFSNRSAGAQMVRTCRWCRRVWNRLTSRYPLVIQILVLFLMCGGQNTFLLNRIEMSVGPLKLQYICYEHTECIAFKRFGEGAPISSMVNPINYRSCEDRNWSKTEKIIL